MSPVNQRAELSRGIQRMSDGDSFHSLLQLRRKLGVDRPLHKGTARRGTSLAIKTVDHEQYGIERTVEIGIVEHDYGVLAAKLEMHALEGRRALRHDVTASDRLTHEGDGLDGGVFGQCLSGGFAQTMNKVDDTFGKTGALEHFAHDFREDHRAQRAPLSRLVHDRAAGRQRGRNLPRRQHERRVPRRDDAHRADRLPYRVVEMRFGRQGQAVARFGRLVRIEPEILRAA